MCPVFRLIPCLILSWASLIPSRVSSKQLFASCSILSHSGSKWEPRPHRPSLLLLQYGTRPCLGERVRVAETLWKSWLLSFVIFAVQDFVGGVSEESETDASIKGRLLRRATKCLRSKYFANFVVLIVPLLRRRIKTAIVRTCQNCLFHFVSIVFNIGSW